MTEKIDNDSLSRTPPPFKTRMQAYYNSNAPTNNQIDIQEQLVAPDYNVDIIQQQETSDEATHFPPQPAAHLNASTGANFPNLDSPEFSHPLNQKGGRLVNPLESKHQGRIILEDSMDFATPTLPLMKESPMKKGAEGK
mmetsp:Transcript_4992/g.8515  ORF Transcript_4992/g.8515 Transcript_4992/m.8515 type:complete len:139 (-) Transcript_4992:142-558(-)